MKFTKINDTIVLPYHGGLFTITETGEIKIGGVGKASFRSCKPWELSPRQKRYLRRKWNTCQIETLRAAMPDLLVDWGGGEIKPFPASISTIEDWIQDRKGSSFRNSISPRDPSIVCPPLRLPLPNIFAISKWKELVYGDQLPPRGKVRKDRDYLSDEEFAETQFAVHRGHYLTLEEFQRISGVGDWEGYAGDSYFSGTLIQFDEEGRYRTALLCS
jgi:hypothetical protein